jgi:hypothetical protein
LLLTLFIMIFLAPTSVQSDYLGGIARHELLDAIVLVIAIPAIFVRNIHVQQSAVVGLVVLVIWDLSRLPSRISLNCRACDAELGDSGPQVAAKMTHIRSRGLFIRASSA